MAQRVGFLNLLHLPVQIHCREAIVSLTSCRVVANLQSIPIKAVIFDIFAALSLFKQSDSLYFYRQPPRQPWSSFTEDSKLIRSIRPPNSVPRSSQLIMFLVMTHRVADIIYHTFLSWLQRNFPLRTLFFFLLSSLSLFRMTRHALLYTFVKKRKSSLTGKSADFCSNFNS